MCLQSVSFFLTLLNRWLCLMTPRIMIDITLIMPTWFPPGLLYIRIGTCPLHIFTIKTFERTIATGNWTHNFTHTFWKILPGAVRRTIRVSYAKCFNDVFVNAFFCKLKYKSKKENVRNQQNGFGLSSTVINQMWWTVYTKSEF